MMLLVGIGFIFFFVCVNTLLESKNNFGKVENNKINKLRLLFFVLILFTGLRNKKYNADYYVYEYLFETYKIALVEPSFKFISFFVHTFFFSNIVFLMLIYATISLGIKRQAINLYSTHPFCSILVFFSDLFLLQDYTQIRAAVALSIFLYSIRYIYNKERGKYFTCVLLAISFHTSAIIMLPIYFLNPHKLHKLRLLFLLIFSFCLALIKFNPMKMLLSFPNGYLYEKAIMYLSNKENYTANILSLYSLIKLLLVLLLLRKSDLVLQENKYFNIFIKIQTLSLCSLYIFSQNLAAALRISEFYSIVDIFLFPLVIDVFKNKLVGKCMLIIICSLWICLRIFRYEVIKV